MSIPRLPTPFGTNWTQWGESLIRVLQPWMQTVNDRFARLRFTDLADAPSSYTGAAGQVVTVNGTEDGLVFAAGGGGSLDVQEEGVSVLSPVTVLNFTGAGVTASSGGGSTAIINVPGGGSGLSGTATVTVPDNSFQHDVTVAAVGVTALSRMFLSLGVMLDTDENSPDMLDIAFIGATPGAGTLRIILGFTTQTSGPIPINWSAL